MFYYFTTGCDLVTQHIYSYQPFQKGTRKLSTYFRVRTLNGGRSCITDSAPARLMNHILSRSPSTIPPGDRHLPSAKVKRRKLKAGRTEAFIVSGFLKRNHALLQTSEVVNTESPLSVVKCIEKPGGHTDLIHCLWEAKAPRILSAVQICVIVLV